MATVLHRVTKQFKRNANTPDYPVADWIINPDLSAVEDVPRRFWKITGDAVSEMNQSEKDVVMGNIEEQDKQAQIAQLDAELSGVLWTGLCRYLADLDPNSQGAVAVKQKIKTEASR